MIEYRDPEEPWGEPEPQSEAEDASLTFELEVSDPDTLFEGLVSSLSQAFPDTNRLSAVYGNDGSIRLIPGNGVGVNSSLINGGDVTALEVIRESYQVHSIRLNDAGVPYIGRDEGRDFLGRVPSTGNARNGEVSVLFRYEEERVGVSVFVNGNNRSPMVKVAVSYLLGFKAGQETPQ